MLVDELLDDYEGYVCLVRTIPKSSLRENIFSISTDEWWPILVSLREVYNSERILACRSLLKEDISFWEEDMKK